MAKPVPDLPIFPAQTEQDQAEAQQTRPKIRDLWQKWSEQAPGSRRRARFWKKNAAPLLVLAVGLGLAVITYAHFQAVADHLWYSPIHDRNAHYWSTLNVAIDIRTGNVGHFFKNLHMARVWGPLHAYLGGIVLAVGGLDYRLAVLPSMMAWVLSGLFAFLLARRLVRHGRLLAGFLAALLVLTSPAHRAFASDIMLESLGACLSLAALYCAVRAYQEKNVWLGRIFGLSLTLLFFHKYNYWLMLLLALVAWRLAVRPTFYVDALLNLFRNHPWREWCIAQFRHPLNYLLAGSVILLTLIMYRDGAPLHLGGWTISTHSPHNLVTVAFALLCLRLWPWWRQVGRPATRALPSPAQQLVYWHAWPVVLWFLWPQRLGYFLWYLTRNHGQDGERHPVLGGMIYYWNCLQDHYHQETLVGGLAVVLALAALATWFWVRPTGRVALWFLVVAGGMTLYHPTLRSRFIHSWIAIVWVLAGVGLANLIYRGLRGAPPAARRIVSTCVVLACAGVLIPGAITQLPHAPEGGAKPERSGTRPFTDAFLPSLADCRHAVILADRPLKFLTGWAYFERYGRHDRVETDLRGFGEAPEQNRQAFERWLKTTKADAVVFMHVPIGSPFFEHVPYPNFDQFPALMGQQTAFHETKTWCFPEHGNIEIILWRRADAALAAGGRRAAW